MNPLRVFVSTVTKATSTQTADFDVWTLLAQIKDGHYASRIESIRNAYRKALKEGRDPKSAVKAQKQNLSAIMFSGRFARRSSDALIEHSGLLCADIDDVGEDSPDHIRDALNKSPHAVTAFLSPTGSGVKAVFRVQPNAATHEESFNAVAKHVLALTHCRIDEQCRDVARLCFTSHDPALWVNPDATELPHCTQRTHSPQRTHSSQISHNPHTGVKDKSETAPVSLPPQNPYVSYVYSIERAVELCLPTTPHTNHKALCRLAGALKAYSLTTGNAVKTADLRAILRLWYQKSEKFLDPKQTETDYYLEFLDAWKNNKRPLGAGIIELAWQNSESAPTPPEAIAHQLTGPVVRFIAFLRELQTQSKGEPFYLSPYKVKALFGHNTHTTACYWLSSLSLLGIITKVENGNRAKRIASSYRFNIHSQ